MNVRSHYVVYTTEKLLGTENLTLKEYDFKRFTTNSFKSKKDAISALIENGCTYQNFLIIKSACISE